MPVVDVDPDELRELTGRAEKSDDELKDDLFALGIEYEGETEEDKMRLEFEADRLDRLSITGIARSLGHQYGDLTGIHVPDTNDPGWTIEVGERVPDERPYVTGAVVRGLDLSERDLEAIIQLQEKLHATMGRKRAKGAIGVHDLTMLKGTGTPDTGGKSIRYVGVEPEGDKFVPLDSDRAMTPAQVLTDHPTGREYAERVTDYDRYPAIYDEIGLFSFPPVINGKRTEVSVDSRDLFIELTGTDQWTIDKMLAILVYALDARGGQVEDVTVAYPDRELARPDLSLSTKTLGLDRVENTLGIDLEPDELRDLLGRAGLEVAVDGTDEAAGMFDVRIPPYRVDVLHPVDLVDDIGRAYGFNQLVPRYPDVSTVGSRTAESRHEEAVRDLLVGLGFEDLLNFNLTSTAELFDRMDLEPGTGAFGAGAPPELIESYSEEFTVLRTWALPSLMQVLENNTHRSYPQHLAEIGFVAEIDESTVTNVAEGRSVAAVLAGPEASYEAAKGRLQVLVEHFGTEVATPATDHPSFIDGRVAEVVLDGEAAGIIGEVHPAVLVEHDLEVPVAGFEFDLASLR